MQKVAVLAGGRSPEHDVSIGSATQVVRHLGPSWEVWPVRLGRDGTWHPSGTPLGPERAVQGFHTPSMEPMSAPEAMTFLLERAGIDVVFPVLHGPGGEDGVLQGFLDVVGVPYVGAGCAASAVAMDKIRTRECLVFHGVPMARAYVPEQPLAHCDDRTEAGAIEAAVGYPCFLKVDVSGSTLGVQRVEGPGEVAAFLAEARQMGRRYLAEAAQSGEEITVAVLGNAGGDLQALPPVGIYPKQDAFFTYAAKYTAELCEEIAPPPGWDADRIARVQEVALRCHRALQCDGMSRTDMIVGSDGPVVLEVNTIPGLTEVSLLPRAAAAAGLSFGALLERLLELGMQCQRSWSRA